jgi:hypothetical protein
VISTRSFSPPGGYTNLYSGAFPLFKNTRNARAMPSMQSRSYLRDTVSNQSTRMQALPAYLLVFLSSIAGDEVSTVLVTRR